MIIYADGAGDGRIAAVVCGSETKTEHQKKVVVNTHNEAEWEALLFAIDNIKGYWPIIIYMDSQLVVRQFNGEYKCRDERMANYRKIARQKINKQGMDVEVKWIRRDDNVAGWLLG